ncbi:hypothetical protein GGR57DRAFT_211018 [Xylariaceae sp. FL1272]|nr:hypothetical protein GGR57DRAFT_211018 [Xylariaceae sp. FL1272]
MRSSNIFAALSTLATTLAMPTEVVDSQLERRASSEWGWITRQYCMTDEGTQIATTSQCLDAKGYLGVNVYENNGCTFSIYNTATDCSGTPVHVVTDGCYLYGGFGSLGVTC